MIIHQNFNLKRQQHAPRKNDVEEQKPQSTFWLGYFDCKHAAG